MTEYEIIFSNDENSIRETYTRFKGVIQYGKTDTLSLNEWLLSNQNMSKKKLRKIKISIHASCDSLINVIRNNGYYDKIHDEISKFSAMEIGNSQEFMDYRKENSLIVKDFSSKCFKEFSEEMDTYKNQMLAEIKRIKKSKIDRFEKMKSNPNSINEDEITALIKTFSMCEPDYRGLEIVILNKTEAFMHATVNSMDQSTFDWFCFKLSNFPKDIDVAQLKQKLKKFDSKSPRKKQVFKSLKNERVFED